MEKITSVAAMRRSDAAEIANGTPSKTLMYRAGLGVYQSYDWHGNIDIVCGSGNNAGDGYVLAMLLQNAGYTCRIVRTSEKLSPDGAYYFAKCRDAGIPVTRNIEFSQTDVIVDCLLGTGFQGQLRSDLHGIVEQIAASGAYVISVDINSGMYGDTGEGFCVRSDLTVSIGTLKYGHLVGLHQGQIGTLCNCDIGIPCIGDSAIIYAPDEAPDPESPQTLPELICRILDAAGIPDGDASTRLQNYVRPVYDRIRWMEIPKVDASF